MKSTCIRSNKVKKFRPTTSKGKVVELDNILVRDFSVQTINEKLNGNITYIHTFRDRWCYLASVMDLHSIKIVGYSFGRKMTIELVIIALENAYYTQRPDAGLAFHSDHSVQYTNDEFCKVTYKLNLKHSVNYKGIAPPYDNTCTRVISCDTQGRRSESHSLFRL